MRTVTPAKNRTVCDCDHDDSDTGLIKVTRSAAQLIVRGWSIVMTTVSTWTSNFQQQLGYAMCCAIAQDTQVSFESTKFTLDSRFDIQNAHVCHLVAYSK